MKSSGIYQLIKKSKQITYEQFCDNRQSWLSQVTSEWLITGHILEEQAIQLIQN